MFECLTDNVSDFSFENQSCNPEDLCNPEMGFDCNPEYDDNMEGCSDG